MHDKPGRIIALANTSQNQSCVRGFIAGQGHSFRERNRHISCLKEHQRYFGKTMVLYKQLTAVALNLL